MFMFILQIQFVPFPGRDIVTGDMKTLTFLLFAVLGSPAVNQYLTGKVQEEHLLEQRQLLLKDVFTCNVQPKVSLIESLKLLCHCLRRRIIHCDSRHRKSMQSAQLAQDNNRTYCSNIIHKGVDTSHQHTTFTIQTFPNFIIDIDFFLFDFEWYSQLYHGLSVSEYNRDGGRNTTYYTGRRLPWTMVTTSNTAVMTIATFAHLKFQLHLFYSITKWSWYPNIKAVYAGMLSDVTYPLDLVTTLQMRNRVFKALSYHFIQTNFNRINISFGSIVASKAQIVIYDGPGNRSPRFLTTNKTAVKTTTFHAYVEVYILSFVSTETLYIYFSQIDKFFSLAYPECARRRDQYGAWSQQGRNTICFIRWPTAGNERYLPENDNTHYSLKILKYIYEGTLITMTGYVTPKCQHGGLYYAPNQNKALCTNRANMWVMNDGSVESILIVWLAGYSRGSVLIAKTKGICFTRHLDNEFVKHNNTVLIDRVRRCQRFICPGPTSPQLQMSNFDIKMPNRPVGSSRIYIGKMPMFEDCVPGFGLNEEDAVYTVSTTYYNHSRFGYNKQDNVSNIITNKFNSYFQYLVSGRVSIPRVCLRGQQHVRPFIVLEMATCGFLAVVGQIIELALKDYLYSLDNCLNHTILMKPGSMLMKHENYNHNYSRHQIITAYRGNCPHNCSNNSFDLKVYHKFNDSVAVYAAKIGEKVSTGFNYQSFWLRFNELPTPCPTKKCDIAVTVFGHDYLRHTDLNPASVKQNWLYNKR